MCSIAVRTRAYALIVLALFAASAHAVPVPWANPWGVQPGQFRWTNGQSESGIFGSPGVGDYSFTFSPANFRAVSAGGNPNRVSDRVSFQIEVDSSLPMGIDLVEVSNINGEYVTQGGGRMNMEMTLVVTGLNQPADPRTNPWTEKANTTPEFPLIIPAPQSAAGGWSAALNKVDLPDDWRKLSISLAITVEATSVADGTTGIWQSPGDIVISFNIPEPVSLAALVPMLAMRRRRAA